MMRTSRVAAGVIAAAVVVAVAGCGSSDEDATADLRETLRQSFEFDSPYELLGTVTYADGGVTVDAEPWADPWSGAATYCDWVSQWLYPRDGADATVTVNVPDRDGGEGDARLVRHGESEDCSEASVHSQSEGR